MSTRRETGRFPAAPKHAAADPQPSARFAHGLDVTLPGFHTATVVTDSAADAETIGDMLRHTGCQVALFDYEPTSKGTYSR